MAHDEYESLRIVAAKLESAPERAKEWARETDGEYAYAYQVGVLAEQCRAAAAAIRLFIEVREERK